MMRPPKSADRAALATACFLALWVTGCAVSAPDPGTLTVAVDSGPNSLDPRLGSDEASRRFNDLVYSALFRVGDDGRPEPELAESLERPEPLTLIVRLRPGVLFHDGAELQAADVVDTYRSILEDRVASFRKSDLEAVASVEPAGPRTVVFRLRRPFAPILTNLNIPILRAGVDQEAQRRPIGTGPFKLVRYRKDEDLLLVRFEGYYEGRSRLERIRLRIIPSTTSRLLELLKGTVDLVVNDLSPDDLARVRGRPGFRTESRPGRNVVYMAFNLADPILADRRVRQAIAWSLDRQEILEHLMHGAAVLATGLLPPGHWAYNAEVTDYHLDAERAKRLLDAAGYPDPDGSGPRVRFRLEYKAPSSELAQQLASVVQEQLAKSGIGVDVRTFEWATFYDDLRAGRFQVVVSNWTEISDPDIYRLRFHSGRRPPNGLNRGGYASEEVDRLIDAGAAESDPQARRADYVRIQALLSEDLPYICLWHREVSAASRERVHGFRLGSGADFRPLWRVTLGEGDPRTPDAADGSIESPAENGLDGPAGHRSGADEPRRVDREVEDRRRAAALGRPRVEDEAHGIPERLSGLQRRRGWRPARSVGAGGDDRPAGGARQGGGYGMRRDAHPDRVPASEQERREVLRGMEHERKGARPEGFHQAACEIREAADTDPDGLAVGGDERQGHALRPALGLEDALDRGRLARVARQAVERLGRVDDQEAASQQLGAPGQGSRIGLLRIHALPCRCHRRPECRCCGENSTIAQVRA
jgi:peptide/nickel transport system substrate-binding protein